MYKRQLLTGTPKPWVGPMDVALSIIGKVFKNNFVKNKVLEFIGPGVHSLSMDFRNGIDTMTTESACLSSVWATDDKVKEYFEIHKRPQGFKEMVPGNVALYDLSLIHIWGNIDISSSNLITHNHRSFLLGWL